MILKLLSKDELIRKYLELEEELTKVQKEKEALEKELRKYRNPNTPPSAHPHLKPNTMGLKAVKGAKRGAPKGHTGTTRARKEFAEPRPITAEECPGCHSKDIEVIGTRHQQVEETPPDIQPTVIDVERDVCKCNNCKLKFLARDGRTPLQGRFGINLMVLVIFLRFIVRGVRSEEHTSEL